MDWSISMDRALRGALLVGLLQLVSIARMPAAEFVFQYGPLSLRFDSDSGVLLAASCRGQGLFHNPTGVPPVTFAVGPFDKPVWFDQMGLTRKLIKQEQPTPDVLELTVAAGPYELIERYRLFRETARLDRSVQLINRGPDTLRLRGLAFRTAGVKASASGFYRFPGVWPPRSHDFAAMQAGHRERGRGTIAPALAELSSAQSLLWTSFTDDSPSIEITEDQGQFDVRQSVSACGYLRPNQPQGFGFVTLQVAEGGYWAALGQLWDWLDSVGLQVPADRPDWVREGILYSFHPGGTTGCGFKDLGGFVAATEKLLPMLPRLGVSAVWTLPIEFRSPYWPLDYYRFADGLGDAVQYRKLIDTAHALGFRVWQDLVPHGGAPQAVHNQAHPEFMLLREDGTHLDYWLNDFKLPAWQRYVADVAAHYMTTYGLDGFRVDACGGSKEPNWNPDIPYARASLAMMQGGLEMMRGIRSEVRRANPRNGAVLAEVESTRQLAACDARYDFAFCYTLCRSWNRMEAGPFVSAIEEYLEEQRLCEPRGVVRLRHIESHDSLRSQGWYGVNGLRAMYALSAWIDGMPMIYQGMEDGHAFALAEINRIRRERPELSRGEAFYRAVHCDTPGVFTCLRQLDDRTSVVVINFNREPVQAQLSWPGSDGTVRLAPFEYAVLPKAIPVATPAPVAVVAASSATGDDIALADAVRFDDAQQWFVDTVEGRLRDSYLGARASGAASRGNIYWRPQGTGVLWQHAIVPLSPTHPRLGFKTAGGVWRIYEFRGTLANSIRLDERYAGAAGLHLLGAGSMSAHVIEQHDLPDEPDVATGVELRGVRLRCVGSQYIISNAHFSVQLQRQGGVLRQFCASGDVLAENQDLYGDQEYFHTKRSSRMEASSDVECGARISLEADGLHLKFEGQIRGDDRYAIKRPPVCYRNEYIFTSAPQFTERWAFRSEKQFHDQKAFLSFFIGRIAADRFRFERTGEVLSEGLLDSSANRSGRTSRTPDTLVFTRTGKPQWSLHGLKAPTGFDRGCFLQGHKFFLPLLDGVAATMDKDVWYAFEVTWNAPTSEKR
jgi:glycosidase